MYLSRLYIENYRSIKKIDLKFEQGKNVIVGRNNSGKSNILKAIDLVLGEYSPTYNKSDNIGDNDFYCGETNKPIFIWCEINRDFLEDGSLEKINFSQNLKSAFYRLFEDRDHTKEFRVKVTDFKREEKYKIFEFTTEKGQATIDNNEVVKKWIGGKSYCRGWTFEKEFIDKANFALAFFACKPKDGEIKKELVFLYRETKDEDWIIGFNCNLRNTLIQSAIIPAFRDPKDQLRITAYSWFGKLLKAYVKTDSKELNDAFISVKDASDALFLHLKQKVSEKEIDIAFPKTTISFQFNPDTKQDIHKSTLIYVNDGFNSELKDKGAGIQSAVTISLYDFYVRNIAHSGSSLLAVEEPELYLHPHGRRVISNRLSRFVTDGKNQVILTTHTTEFLSNIHETQNIISVKKTDISTTATNIYFNTAKRKQILIKKQNSELFFADAVILTEGADKYFIEEAARCFGKEKKLITADGELIPLGENWINEFNVSIINCTGKSELWKYAEILKEIDIKFITTADFDFIREGLNSYFTRLNYPQAFADTLNSLKSKISQSILEKYKSLAQINDNDLRTEVSKYLLFLREHDIFVFSGELENFYLNKPTFDKEAGVIETLGKLIEQSKGINEFVNIEEYYALLSHFCKSQLGLQEYKEE